MYKINNGIYTLWGTLAKEEKKMIEYCERILEQDGYQLLSIPTTIPYDTIVRQETVKDFHDYGINRVLGGSAEQGILTHFRGADFDSTSKYCATNQCFRREDKFDGLLRVREFRKVEQFVFCHPDYWSEHFERCLQNAEDVLDYFGIEHRRNAATGDTGYFKMKVDIEAYSEQYGWIETHSCTYFGDEQSKRFKIGGTHNHTISCTGIAVPRALVPLIDQLDIN